MVFPGALSEKLYSQLLCAETFLLGSAFLATRPGHSFTVASAATAGIPQGPPPRFPPSRGTELH